MGERAHAGYFVRIAHIDERMCSLCAPRERALGFALIRVDIYPALLQAAAADRLYIFLAHWRQTFADQFHASLKRDLHLFLRNGSPHIVISKFLQSKCPATDVEVTVPDGQVLLERIDQIMEDIRRDVQIKERCCK